MLRETLEWLDLQAGQTVVDMTVGLGGHGREIIEQIGPQGRYLGLEWDPQTFALAQAALVADPERRSCASASRRAQVTLVNEDFLKLPEALAEAGIQHADGILLDAGVNLYQLTAPERSLSQDSEAGLDMRMRPTEGVPAETLVAESSEEQLREILRATLAEREARQIARGIMRARSREPIRTTRRLAEAILATLSPQARRSGRQPAPALLAFRIAVNRELENLEEGILLAVEALRPQTGRIVVLSFHSAEFRVVRETMRRLARPCQCPPRLPCVCGLQPRLTILTPKPPGPEAESLALSGPQCRSARLHAAQAV
jgi:16S rRNA (cytosine1402-N4)-methyltransferase